jgi:hypothetical protein
MERAAMLTRIKNRVLNFAQRLANDGGLDAEVRLYAEMLTEENMRSTSS